MFYGLFLRGHSADTIRKDIDVPTKLFQKLLKRHRNELALRSKLQRSYLYRKDRKSTRLNSSHVKRSRMPSSA